jgi:hypothetical protein
MSAPTAVAKLPSISGSSFCTIGMAERTMSKARWKPDFAGSAELAELAGAGGALLDCEPGAALGFFKAASSGVGAGSAGAGTETCSHAEAGAVLDSGSKGRRGDWGRGWLATTAGAG